MNINKNYQFIKLLQKSEKSTVYIAENNSLLDNQNKTVVVKSFHKIQQRLFTKNIYGQSLVPKEMHYMNLIKNSKLCPEILDHLENENEFAIVMEHLKGNWTDLYEYVTSKDRLEKCIKKIMKNVIQAIESLIDLGVYHLDIKPENIMFNKKTYQIKILDFEDAYFDDINSDPIYQLRVGTLGYCGPEIFENKYYNINKSIVFMLGSTAYCCIEGQTPFEEMSDYDNFNIKFSRSSDEAVKFIKECLKLNPIDRIELNELSQHPWLQ